MARHCITAVWPISITFVFGLCVITGKPAGALSAENDREEDNGIDLNLYICSFISYFYCILENTDT